MKKPIIYTTQSQTEIWTACKLGGEDANRGYNESFSIIFTGHLNKDALRNAIQTLIDRHESLRSNFSDDGRFITVHRDISIVLDDHDISGFTATEKDRIIEDYLSSHSNFVFDLKNGPLFKIELIKLSETEHHFLFTAHHIICDGWSIRILLKELSTLYSNSVSNTNHDLPKPDCYRTYAKERQLFLGSEAHKASESYWLNQYANEVPHVTLTTDFPRPELRTYKSERLDIVIDNSLVNGLKKIGDEVDCSFENTLLSAFEIFINSQTSQDEIVLGLLLPGQAVNNKPQLIGHCVNLLPLRSKIDLQISFVDYVNQRKPQLAEAYEHQLFSYGELLQKLSITRDPSLVPLAPIVFNVDLNLSDSISFSNLDYKLKSNPRAYETFELFVNVTGSEEDLVIELSYNTALFKTATIEKLMISFRKLLKQIVETPKIKLETILKVDESRYQILNATYNEYPKLPLHQLLAEQAQVSPDKIALIYGASKITYQEFEEQVNQLAHRLTAQGVKPGTITAVALPRSIELVISLVAIMQCGSAYLPLDPSYPQQRLDFMMDDSKAEVLISSNELDLSLKSIPKLLMIEDLFTDLSQFPLTPQTLSVDIEEMVYLLYTSGSTGNPKGVQVTHKNLVNFLYGMVEKPGIEETDKLLSITTISFDIAGLELYLPLLRGATLVIANDEIAKDTRLMLEVLEEENISILQATPTTWQMLLDAGWENHLPIKALSGGEAIPMSLATKLLNRVDELWNMYGPTETTIWSTVKQIKSEDSIITIGEPIANTQLYIVNDNGQLMEPGQIGELCIAGDGVAKGYWRRPDLTSEKFINNIFNKGEDFLLYKTGDLAKILPSGEVQCLGRIDQQVKIRGHRIELGEIEEAINKLEKVETSVVLVREDRLEAYVISHKQKEILIETIKDWKTQLSEELPSYMVPVEFHFINEFPTTLNGKIDRKALNSPFYNSKGSKEYTAPRTETEKIIASIWKDCLKRDKIDVYSDFFDLGGHSLIAVKVMSLIEKKTGKRLPLSALMLHSTVKKLAESMDVEVNETSWNSLVPVKSEGTKNPVYVVHGAEHNVMFLNALAKNVDGSQPVYGLQSKGLNGIDKPHNKIEDMASNYISEIINANPTGPYVLAGYSFGGVIAFEMARQMIAQDKKVDKVILLDSYVYPSYYHANALKKRITHYKYTISKVLFMTQKMFSNKSSFNRRIQLFKEGLVQSYSKLKHGKEKHHEMRYSWPYELDKMHKVAICNYQISPLDITVDLLRVAEDDIFYAHDADTLGWKNIATKGVRRHLIPGNHRNMISHPHDKELARILQNVLDN
ncbi:non-ribosomal peptide synthetase [Winogradskyella helgolandensis]|uniref:non-ribosomal peptide synthetase n=1 Tax=Winogradskyella helgolandensis TaxID=2697010 RepID=UPI0015CE9BC8|nr:non-ribosomal peptide synthetase [Winogradskyella helgolandensis]